MVNNCPRHLSCSGGKHQAATIDPRIGHKHKFAKKH